MSQALSPLCFSHGSHGPRFTGRTQTQMLSPSFHGATQISTKDKKMVLQSFCHHQLSIQTESLKGRFSPPSMKWAFQRGQQLQQQSTFNLKKSFVLQCLGSRDENSQLDLASSQEIPTSVTAVDMFEDRTSSHPHSSQSHNNFEGTLINKSKKFRNKYLGLVRLGSVLNSAAESFFKSEIRRRLFVTVVLAVASRVGYFIPLPGFDHRLRSKDYLDFVSGSGVDSGDLSSELPLSLFQLGITPYITASITIQLLCYCLPALIKERKEGLNWNEKIKRYIWWMSLTVAIVQSLVFAFLSLPYSVFAASHRFQHCLVTACLLTVGSIITNWICEKISDAGFGHGISVIICVGILSGCADALQLLITRISSSGVNWVPSLLWLFGFFTFVTVSAILVTEGVRKVPLQYFGFKIAPTSREGASLSEVKPYIPFSINPAGMHPIITTTYVLAIPSILARILQSPFWKRMQDNLNPTVVAASGSRSWVYYMLHFLLIFLFNILDIANLPKEISDYMMKMGARIPNIKPGQASMDYLAKIQASTRFWGGLLLSLLATLSTFLDNHFQIFDQRLPIGFTSVLIIVGSIIELRRSYQAYNVMPTLSKVLKRYGV